VKYFTFLVLIIVSCSKPVDETLSDGQALPINDSFFQGQAVFKKLTGTIGFKVLLMDAANQISDQTIFNFTPYHLDTADVNRDGRTDILIGLIKSTEFDREERKRLFILRIDEGHLRPLWLGSKVCQELVDFKAATQGIILTLEKTQKGNYAIGQYEWQGFGLTLINYTHNEISYHDASAIFKN
jgi:hypothetical protein